VGDGDGWVVCSQGHRHWGRYGAAGLLLRERGAGLDRVVLQHRAWWSHQGGTWGLPGGARNSDESAVTAALRETGEEAGIDPAAVWPTGVLVDDHGGWSYSSVVGAPLGLTDPRPTGGESEDVRWVDTDAVDSLPLHPGFAATWPRLRAAPRGLVLIVDTANVVGAGAGGDRWWRDRAGATRRLLATLAPLASGLPAASLPPRVDAGPLDVLLPHVVAVVEGAARSVADDVFGPVEVVAAPGSGDDTLVEVASAATAGYTALVVTADRELRERVARVGAHAVGPSWLLELLTGR
jgi:8-oxo-dGTP diphosphatase